MLNVRRPVSCSNGFTMLISPIRIKIERLNLYKLIAEVLKLAQIESSINICLHYNFTRYIISTKDRERLIGVSSLCGSS